MQKSTFYSFADLHFARVDSHRIKRQGFPEAIYCPGKTISQILPIFESLGRGPGPVLATRVTEEAARAIVRRFPKAVYHPQARMVVWKSRKINGDTSLCVLTGGTADLPVAEEAAVTAHAMGRSVTRLFDVGVAGLHRLLIHQRLLAKAKAIVVCAGMEGALASVVGGLASCPVIAVPTSVGYGAHLKGIAPLLTMLNSCASNVSVVNIDNGFSAGVIASLIAR